MCTGDTCCPALQIPHARQALPPPAQALTWYWYTHTLPVPAAPSLLKLTAFAER
jgi:hypothetical protein